MWNLQIKPLLILKCLSADHKKKSTGPRNVPSDSLSFVSLVAASADIQAASTFPENLAKLIEQGVYCAPQIFNVDKTALF
jgi:hypothetical protein